MADDWIKLRHSLRTCPEIVRISSDLNRDKLWTVGAMYVLWSIADMHADTLGGLHGYTAEAIDAEIGCPGFA